MIILYIFCFLILVSLRFINVSKRCTECSSKDIQFLRTEVDSGYKHKTKSGRPDKRYKNNYFSRTSYIFYCNKCKEDFQDLSVTQRDRTKLNHTLIDETVRRFIILPKIKILQGKIDRNRSEIRKRMINFYGDYDSIPESVKRVIER